MSTASFYSVPVKPASGEEYPDCRKIIVALDRISRMTDDSIEIMYMIS